MCIEKRILACFKIVRDLESAIEEDWASAVDESFDIDYTRKIISCFDEAALETTLCIADRNEGIRATAVTIGDEPIGDFIKNLYAIGFDEVVQIQTDQDLRFRPQTVARLLARYVQDEGGFDAIVMGGQASPGDNRQIPYLLAELLNMPCMDFVADLKLMPEGMLAWRETQGCVELYQIATPAIYAMENAKHAYLRVATLREKLAASKKQARVLTAEELGSVRLEKEAEVQRMYPARKARTCRFLSSDPEVAAKELVEEYITPVLKKEKRN